MNLVFVALGAMRMAFCDGKSEGMIGMIGLSF